MQKNQHASIFTVLMALTLFSCSNHSPAPVVDISYPVVNPSTTETPSDQKQKVTQINETYQVKPGDTLFSIAWRFSLDFEQLAKVNQLKSYRIYPGQELSLNVEDEEPVFSSESLLAAINKEILHKNNTKQLKQRQIKVRRQSIVKTSPSKARRANKESNSDSRKTAKVSAIKHWIWPVNGKIINHFSAESNQSKGVDIVAKLGDPVRAAAKGRVVYSGSGLRGYGRLVIIKHDDNYLSAYAHNNKLHVEENEFVKAGQRIADLGSSGSDREKLHFEIRYKGKPVDPLNYLPKSGLL